MSKNPNEAVALQVARLAQVSRAAVSRAFNPEAPLDPEKRARILQIARDLDYVPNRVGRALKTGRSQLIASVVADARSPWEAMEIDGLSSALQDRGFGCVLFKATKQGLAPTVLRNLRAFDPDAVVVFPEEVTLDSLSPYLGRARAIYVDYCNLPLAAIAQADRLEIDLRPGMADMMGSVAKFRVL